MGIAIAADRGHLSLGNWIVERANALGEISREFTRFLAAPLAEAEESCAQLSRDADALHHRMLAFESSLAARNGVILRSYLAASGLGERLAAIQQVSSGATQRSHLQAISSVQRTAEVLEYLLVPLAMAQFANELVPASETKSIWTRVAVILLAALLGVTIVDAANYLVLGRATCFDFVKRYLKRLSEADA